MNKWSNRFLNLAELVGSWSRDPSTKVGAVIVRPDKTIASVGFNGLPRGVEDTPERLDDRPTKYAMTLHAEINAILHSREPLVDYTIYIAPMHPCAQCTASIIQVGIKTVVVRQVIVPERWEQSFSHAGAMMLDAGVQVVRLT